MGDACAVEALFLNKPTPGVEKQRFEAKVVNIAAYRQTRLGRVFFAALRGTPAVSGLPAGAETASLSARWSLARECELSVTASWRRKDGLWLIETLTINLSGAAAAPFANALPYFGLGQGPVDVALLDAAEIDELAMAENFAVEEEAHGRAIDNLRKALTGPASREDKLAAIARHTDDAALIIELRATDADASRRWALWDGLKKQWELAVKWPRLSSGPKNAGGRFQCGYQGAQVSGTGWVERLKSGKVAVGGSVVEPPPEVLEGRSEASNQGAPNTPATEPGKERRHGKARKSD